jgi:hypothetical protein
MADPRVVNYEQALQAFYGTHSSGADVFSAGVSFENYLEDGRPTDGAGAARVGRTRLQSAVCFRLNNVSIFTTQTPFHTS